jgi:hypothetical protein
LEGNTIIELLRTLVISNQAIDDKTQIVIDRLDSGLVVQGEIKDLVTETNNILSESEARLLAIQTNTFNSEALLGSIQGDIAQSNVYLSDIRGTSATAASKVTSIYDGLLIPEFFINVII